MSEPLKSWHCDTCQKLITDVEQGYVIWQNNDAMKSHGFKLIHRGRCDPQGGSSAPLSDFLGDAGLSQLLAFLSAGPIKAKLGRESYCDVADLDEFVDFVRRLHIPYYEEARRKFSNADLLLEYDDANQVLPYLPETLEDIAKRY